MIFQGTSNFPEAFFQELNRFSAFFVSKILIQFSIFARTPTAES